MAPEGKDDYRKGRAERQTFTQPLIAQIKERYVQRYHPDGKGNAGKFSQNQTNTNHAPVNDAVRHQKQIQSRRINHRAYSKSEDFQKQRPKGNTLYVLKHNILLLPDIPAILPVPGKTKSTALAVLFSWRREWDSNP